MHSRFIFNELKIKLNCENYIEKENILFLLNCKEEIIFNLFLENFIADADLKRNQQYLKILSDNKNRLKLFIYNSLTKILIEKKLKEEDIFYRLYNLYQGFSYENISCDIYNFSDSPLSYALYFLLRAEYIFKYEELSNLELLKEHKFIFDRIVLLIFNEEFLNEKYIKFINAIEDSFESKQIIKIVFIYLKNYLTNNSIELMDYISIANKIYEIRNGEQNFPNNNTQIFISDNSRFENLLLLIPNFKFMFLFSNTLKNISQTVICRDIKNFTCQTCKKFALPYLYNREIYIENISWLKLADYFMHHKKQKTANNLKKIFKLYIRPENNFYAELFKQFSADLIFLFMNDYFKNFYLKCNSYELEKLIDLFPHLNLNSRSYEIISEFTYENFKKKIPNNLIIFIRNTQAEIKLIKIYMDEHVKNYIEMEKNQLFFILKNLSESLNLKIENLFYQYSAILIASLIENNIKLNNDLYQYIPSAVAYLMGKRQSKNLSIYKSYIENNIYEFFIHLLINRLEDEILRKFISKYEQVIRDNPIRFFFFLKNAYRTHQCFYGPLLFLLSHVQFLKINFEIIKNSFHFIFKMKKNCKCINKTITDRKYIVEYLMRNEHNQNKIYIFQLIFPYISSEALSKFNLPVEQFNNILLNSKSEETQQAALNILLKMERVEGDLKLLYNFNKKFSNQIILLMIANSAVRKDTFINSSLTLNNTIDSAIRTIIQKLFFSQDNELSNVNYFIIQEFSRKLRDYKTYPYNIFIDTEYIMNDIIVEKKIIKQYSLNNLNRLYNELYYFVYNLMEEEKIISFWNLGVLLKGEPKKIFILMMCSILLHHKYNEKLVNLLNSFIYIDCEEVNCNCIVRAILHEKSSDSIFYGFYKFHPFKNNISYELFLFLFEINRFCGIEILSYKYLLIYALYFQQYCIAYWCINKIMDKEVEHKNFTDFNLIFQHYFYFICKKIKLNIKLCNRTNIYFFKKNKKKYTKEFFLMKKTPNILSTNTEFLYQYIYNNLINDMEFEKTEALVHFLKDLQLKDNLNLIRERRKNVNQRYILKYHLSLTKDKKFNDELHYEIFKYHLKKGNIKLAKKIIKKMLKERKFEALYFKSFLYKKSKNHSLKILRQAKKYLKTGHFFKKSIEQIALIKKTERGFKKAIKLIGANEILSFAQAKYFQEKDIKKSYFYLKETLFFGTTYLDIAIPTILNIFCEKILDDSLLISDILNIVGSVKLKQFLLQIIPKLNHSNPYIAFEIEKLIIGLYNNHPSYCTWKLIAFFNSTNREMKNKMNALKKKLNLDYHKKILTFISSLRKIGEVKSKNAFKLSNIIENTDRLKNIELLLNDEIVHVEYFNDSVHVYKSLMAPKRISFITKDGQKRSLILKNDDDLRRDQRMMDLFNFINKHLHFGIIRTYGVLPIDSKFGFIEMISNLSSLRELCNFDTQLFYKIYLDVKSKGIYDNRFDEVSALVKPGLRNSFYKIFNGEKIFIKNLNNFIATYAVMCAVGWLIGLGDRHLENITVDMKSGDTVHVDINLIFGTAQLLTVPEQVPFRLTKNIIHSFGPMRLEIFQKYFSKTLNILYNEREMIEANLLSFIYDPLTYLNFTRNSDNKIIRRGNKINFYEILKSKFENYNKELAKKLISDATKKENLQKMFIGWCPHI